MKYIEIPEDIDIYNLNGERMKGAGDSDATVSFEDFVLGRLGDPKFAESVQNVIAAVEIKTKLKDANGVLALENEHYSLLKQATDKPSAQSAYHPAVAHNLLPFMKAIMDASDKTPAKIVRAGTSEQQTD